MAIEINVGPKIDFGKEKVQKESKPNGPVLVHWRAIVITLTGFLAKGFRSVSRILEPKWVPNDHLVANIAHALQLPSKTSLFFWVYEWIYWTTLHYNTYIFTSTGLCHISFVFCIFVFFGGWNKKAPKKNPTDSHLSHLDFPSLL